VARGGWVSCPNTPSEHLGRAKSRFAPGVWQMGWFALPLLVTGEKVRDIGVGAGVGQWAQQG